MFTVVAEVKKHKIRVIKSCALYSCLFVWGLSIGIIGPTLIDLAVQTGTDLTKTSLIIPIRAGGYMGGSLAASIIHDRVNVLLSCACALSLASLTTILVPLIRDIWALLSTFVVMGFAFGMVEASANVHLLHLWGKEVTPFLQGLTFFFGLGALLAPLITKPFILPIEVSSDRKNCDGEMNFNQTVGVMTTTVSYGNATLKTASSIGDFAPSDLQLIYPYALIAVFAFAAVIFFTLLYIYVPNTEPHPSRLTQSSVGDRFSSRNSSFTRSIGGFAGRMKSEKNLFDQAPVVNQMSATSEVAERVAPREMRSRLRWYHVEDPTKLTIIGLSAAFILVYLGLELTLGSFLAPFTVNSNVHMDSREGAQLASIFWAAFTFWRLFTILYIGFTGPAMAIILNLVIIAVGAGIIVPWGFDQRWALYTGTILLGVGISPIWGGIFGFLESQFPVSSSITSYLMISCAVGELIFPLFISYYIECEPIFFIYFIALCSVLVACAFAAILLVCHCKKSQRSSVASGS